MNETPAPVCLLVVGISPARIGGMEMLLKETCRQLRDRGWSTVLALEGGPGPVALGVFGGLPEGGFWGGLRGWGGAWRGAREGDPAPMLLDFWGDLREVRFVVAPPQGGLAPRQIP